MGDLLPYLFLSVPILLFSFCTGYLEVPTLVLTLPQKSFIPMGELFEDWWSFWRSF